MDNRIIVKNKKQNNKQTKAPPHTKKNKTQTVENSVICNEMENKISSKRSWNHLENRKTAAKYNNRRGGNCTHLQKTSSGLSQTELPLPGNPSDFRKVEETGGKHKVCNQE